jgi:hypothetical protein
VAISRREEQSGAAPDPVVASASIWSGLGLALGAWLVTRAVVGISYAPTRNPFAAKSHDWARWDSVNYLLIALHGRTFGRCDRAPFAGAPNPLGVKWCGTAGWLPGYPWLVSVVHATHVGVAGAALTVSWITVAIVLFLVWYGWCRPLSPARAFVVLVLFGLFPGAVYNFAIFPTSLALALVVGALIAASRDRWLLAVLLMAAAGLCYPSAWFAAIGFAVALIASAPNLEVGVLVRRGALGLIGLAGLFILVGTDRPWNAFFLMDHQQGLQASKVPGQDFLRLVFLGTTAEQQFLGGWTRWVLSVQGLLAVLIAGTAGALAFMAWRRRRADALLLYPAAVGVAVILGILTLNANGGAWNRSVVLAAPSVLALRTLPKALLVAAVIAVGVTTAIISNGFFDGRLI